MMTSLQKNKNLIIVVALVVVAFWVYVSFFKPDNSSTPADPAAQQVGSDVLDLYASLQSVTLDQSLFSSDLYKRLVDFSTTIPSQPAGRSNPFDTIGRD